MMTGIGRKGSSPDRFESNFTRSPRNADFTLHQEEELRAALALFKDQLVLNTKHSKGN